VLGFGRDPACRAKAAGAALIAKAAVTAPIVSLCRNMTAPCRAPERSEPGNPGPSMLREEQCRCHRPVADFPSFCHILRVFGKWGVPFREQPRPVPV